MEWICTDWSNLEQGTEEGQSVEGDWSGLGEICAVEVAFIKLYGITLTHVGLDVFNKALDSFLALLDTHIHNLKSQWMVCDFCFIPSYPHSAAYQKYQID